MIKVYVYILFLSTHTDNKNTHTHNKHIHTHNKSAHTLNKSTHTIKSPYKMYEYDYVMAN